jgi:hypothetical protein
MAQTLRTVLNRVLRPLGEPVVATGTSELTEDYHLKVTDFINLVKEEIEEAHQWRSLMQTITGTVNAAAYSVVLSGTNERTRLMRLAQSEDGQLQPLIFDVTDTNNPFPMLEIDLAEMKAKHALAPDSVTSPGQFALGVNGDAIELFVYPPASVNRNYQLHMIVPQAYLTGTTDLDTVLLIPYRPLVMGTLAYAYEDRGEELGPNSLYSMDNYQRALDSAIALDNGEQGDAYELVPV